MMELFCQTFEDNPAGSAPDCTGNATANRNMQYEIDVYVKVLQITFA